MEREELSRYATPEAIAAQVARQSPTLREARHQHGHPAGGVAESVREATYHGHRIVVRTTYTITVDDTPVTGHLGVTNDGRVHYHAIPNISFASAVKLVEQLIDTFPEDFPGPGADRDPGRSGTDGTGHHHGEEG